MDLIASIACLHCNSAETFGRIPRYRSRAGAAWKKHGICADIGSLRPRRNARAYEAVMPHCKNNAARSVILNRSERAAYLSDK